MTFVYSYGKLKLTIMIEGEKMNNRIEEYRKPLGLSQHRLGKRIGISRVSINKIETGKVVPSLKVANDIANALSVCMYQIFDLDGTGSYECPNCQCS